MHFRRTLIVSFCLLSLILGVDAMLKVGGTKDKRK